MTIKAVVLGAGLIGVMPLAYAQAQPDALRFIVKYKDSHSSLSSLRKELGNKTNFSVSALKPMANGAYSLILKAPVSFKESDKQQAAETILQTLRHDDAILYAVKDRVGYFKPLPETKADPLLEHLLSHDSQWDEFKRPAGVMLESKPGLKDGAWSMTTGQHNPPIVVAVLDTGIAMNDSIVNNLVKDDQGAAFGWNFAGNNRDISDETESYHGTHVSGTIAGYGDVMTGMGEHLKILTAKIPDKSGMFYESYVINAMYWSVGADIPGVPKNMHPAKVLNMSFGVDERPGKEIDHCDEALQEAIFYARKTGAVLVAAAGNDNRWEHYNAPAACNGTLKIASTGPEGLRSYFSNYGPSVTIAAPGGDKRYGTKGGILSTVNPGGGYNGSGFNFYQGTSMAAPHVAGVAGLIFAASDKKLTTEEVEQVLYVTTHDFAKSDNPNNSCVDHKPCGHGILDAEQAIKAVVADYTTYISAPKGIKACRNGVIEDHGLRWISQDQTCASPKVRPHVIKDAHGQIWAVYDAVRYRLDKGVYSVCDIVGFDGVGCKL